MISQSTVILLGISSLLTILIPILLAVFWILKTKSYVYPLFIGVLIYFIFVMILESSMHAVVFETFPAFSSNLFLYMIYGCLAASFFEEGGRWIAFKYLIKSTNKKNAVTYGIGHAGIEMILVVGMSLLSTYVFAQGLNVLGIEGMMGQSVDASTHQMIVEMTESIQLYGMDDFILTLVERISTLVLHVSCSILVYYSIKENHAKFLGYAIGLHAIMNVPAVLAQKGILTNLFVVESIFVMIAIVIAYIGYQTYKKL